MSPGRANVIIIEDDGRWRKKYKEELSTAGHVILGEAETLDEAFNLIGTLENLNVAIVDGNLNPYDKSGRDGQIISQTIKERFPNVVVIGMSARREDSPWADRSVEKENYFHELANTVTRA